MFKFHNQLLPPVFNDLFISVNRIHSYNTRHAAKQSYYLPKARTNYGIFNIRFQGLEYGIQLKNKSNLRLLNCLKKNSKIIFYANTRFFFVGIFQIVELLFLFLFAYVYSN